eukprot:6004053-Prymnesium_polylepis.1
MADQHEEDGHRQPDRPVHAEPVRVGRGACQWRPSGAGRSVSGAARRRRLSRADGRLGGVPAGQKEGWAG